MAVEQVQLRPHDLWIVPALYGLDRIREVDAVHRSGAVIAAGFAGLFQIEIVPAEEAQTRQRHRIVHDRIELIALQPAPGFMPDFAHEIRLAVDALHPAAKLAPELVVVDLFRHIQAPTVDAELYPVRGDVPEELAHGGGVGVELGQSGNVPPRLIAERVETALALPQGTLRDRIGISREVSVTIQAFGIEVEPIHVG